MIRKAADTLLAAACALAMAASLARAQDFPSKPLRVIVPFPAGGPVDVLARALGEAFRERTGATFIVDNKPGGATAIGATACKNADADGYTFCLLTASTISLNPFLYANLSYDPQKDLEPLSNVVSTHQVMILHKSIPASSMRELVAYAIAKSGPAQFRLLWGRRRFASGFRMAQGEDRSEDGSRSLWGRRACLARLRARRSASALSRRLASRARTHQVGPGQADRDARGSEDGGARRRAVVSRIRAAALRREDLVRSVCSRRHAAKRGSRSSAGISPRSSSRRPSTTGSSGSAAMMPSATPRRSSGSSWPRIDAAARSW